MEYYNNTLCVEYNFLMENGIMSDKTYKRLVEDRVLNRIRRACMRTPALIAYDSFPYRFQDKIKKVVPDLQKDARMNMVENCIKQSAAASAFFDEYTLPDGRHLTPEVRREYYANAIVLSAVKDFLMVKREKRASFNKRMVRSWKQLAEFVQDIDRVKYPHTLPTSHRRLEDKYKKYQKEGYAGLVHKNFLNVNAAKVDDAVKESVIIELLADPRNLSNEQVRVLYDVIAEKMNWKKITASAVSVWRDRYDLGIYAGRRGTNAFGNRKAMQVKRKAPSFPLYYWTLDGWDVELLYRKTAEGHTTFHNRPTVVVVLDACLKYPVGYAVGTHETPDLIRAALRNSEKHVQQLFGGMYRTQQLQSDHYAIKSMTRAYETVTERYTPARVGNAKSKIVEPYFNSINRTYCQLMPNWSGFGIASGREKQPNMEIIQKNKAGFPDFEGVSRQIDLIIEREREDKIGRYMELWSKIPEEHKVLLPYEQYLLQFGDVTGYRNQLQGNGLRVTIDGLKYDYDCFDLTFRDHFSVKWEVRYDPDDLSRVLAVNEDETLRYMMEEKFVQPMALIERREGDFEQLQRVRDFNEQLEDKVTEFRAISGDNVRRLIEGRPELDTLKKFLITDNRGQHKDRRNDVRGKAVEAVVVEEGGSELDICDMY
jgi:CRISPR/Cas system CSM-associated protein Csm2 small subunit